ncbi:MAG TPA: hypothetical protein VN452_02725 [Longilinea sp.]|nr:hypothetical protein [Longilinea sp.]
MGDQGKPVKLRSVTIHFGTFDGKIEEIPSTENGKVKMRISGWSEDKAVSHPLELDEKELVDLLQKAVRAGILSPDFVKDLSSEFEI